MMFSFRLDAGEAPEVQGSVPGADDAGPGAAPRRVTEF
jgi:hypothetical protein